MEKQIVEATLRCIGQLLLLGFILQPVILSHEGLPVLLVCVAMLLIAASESCSRVQQTYRGTWLHCLCSLFVANICITMTCIFAVVQPDPWWRADYFIPLWGMLLGNAVNGVAVGLNAMTQKMKGSDGDNVELLLAAGASRLEAVLPVMSEAVKLGVTSQINTMANCGIIAIPGMMTGQILGGMPPSEAAYYQMMIMFFLTTDVVLSVIFSVLFATSAIIDKHNVLRRDLLISNTMKRDWVTESVKRLCRSCCRVPLSTCQPTAPPAVPPFEKGDMIIALKNFNTGIQNIPIAIRTVGQVDELRTVGTLKDGGSVLGVYIKWQGQDRNRRLQQKDWDNVFITHRHTEGKGSTKPTLADPRGGYGTFSDSEEPVQNPATTGK